MTAADRIRARIAELEGIRERYLAYQQDRVNERDHHGAWDVAVNLSETECEISGLRFALNALDDEVLVNTNSLPLHSGPGPCPPYPHRCEAP